jgi:hypothetical protein
MRPGLSFSHSCCKESSTFQMPPGSSPTNEHGARRFIVGALQFSCRWWWFTARCSAAHACKLKRTRTRAHTHIHTNAHAHTQRHTHKHARTHKHTGRHNRHKHTLIHSAQQHLPRLSRPRNGVRTRSRYTARSQQCAPSISRACWPRLRASAACLPACLARLSACFPCPPTRTHRSSC